MTQLRHLAINRRASCRLVQTLFVAWLLCLVLPAAHAAGRVALLIGNKDYVNQSTLATPINDVKLIEQTLVAQGFKVERLENQTKRDMDRAVQRFVAQSAGADVALFYYAGHGEQPLKGGRNFLLPVDAKIASDGDLKTEAVLADDIVRDLEDADKPARLRLVILDACRSNPKGRRIRDDRGLAPIQTGDQYTLVGFSTNERAPALDAIGNSAHSPYAEALARWLKRVGEITVRQVFDKTAADVRRSTRDQQQPRVSGDLPGDVLLNGNAVVDDFSAWEVARSSGSVAVLEEFLKNFATSHYAPEAKVRLAALKSVTQPASTAGQLIKDCAECPELVLLPTSSFTMGSPDSEKDRDGDEGPQHRVTIHRPIAVGRHEVSRGEFARFVNDSKYQTEAEKSNGCAVWTGAKYEYKTERNWMSPGFEQADDHPVVCVSWNDAQAYLRWLNGKAPGKAFRLLSEAEWEYAARAGTSTPFSTGQTITTQQANFDGNYTYNGSAKGPWRQKTVAVGSFAPNASGLHDMHGNVWEWVQDVYHDSYTGAPADGSAWETGGDTARRVLRGGSWFSNPRGLRSANRVAIAPDSRDSSSGFRLARTY